MERHSVRQTRLDSTKDGLRGSTEGSLSSCSVTRTSSSEATSDLAHPSGPRSSRSARRRPARPAGYQAIQLAQAERFDVVVDWSGYPVGASMTLINRLGEGLCSAATAGSGPLRRRQKDTIDLPSGQLA
jgi:hypothetical protein